MKSNNKSIGKAVMLCLSVFLFTGIKAIQAAEKLKPIYEISIPSAWGDYKPGDLCFWSATDRGYYALFMELIPQDISKGSALVAWDVSTGRVTRVIEDLNTFCGDPKGKQGARFADVITYREKKRGRELMIAANSSTGVTILRYVLIKKEIDVVAKFDNAQICLKLFGHGYAKPFMLLKKADKEIYQLQNVEDGKVLLEGGPEMANLRQGGGRTPTVHYLGKNGAINHFDVAKGTSTNIKPSSKESLLHKVVAGEAHPLADGTQVIGPRYYMQQPSNHLLTKDGKSIITAGFNTRSYPHFTGPGKEIKLPEGFGAPFAQNVGNTVFRSIAKDSIKTAGLSEGFIAGICSSNNGQHLMILTPGNEKIRDLGPLLDKNGKPVDKVLWLGLDLACNLIAITKVGKETQASVYLCPILDDILTLKKASREKSLGALPQSKIRAQTVASFHQYGNEQDRGWDPYLRASDGNLYLGAMPHHPNHSTRIWKYDSKTGKLNDLGSFDKLAGQTGEFIIPSMMHGTPVELDGKVYFIGQDPFYGKRYFPTMPPDVEFPGSSVLELDLATGKFKSLGIPVPTKSVHGVLPAFGRKGLYLSASYWKSNWHYLDLTTGKTREIPLKGMGKHQHVGPDGKFYFVAAKTGEVTCFDPEGDKTTVLSTISLADFPSLKQRETGKKKDIGYEPRWFTNTLGKEKAIGYINSLEAVVELDTTTGKVRCIGLLRPEQTEVPREHGHTNSFRSVGLSGRTVLGLRSLSNKTGKYVELHTLDLDTGKATNHGVLRDEKGRFVRECNCMGIGPDGNAYIGAWVHAEPGDRNISHRFMLKSGQLSDTVFARIPIGK